MAVFYAMKIKKYVLTILTAAGIALASCDNNKPAKVSTDAISITASADSGRAAAEAGKRKPVITFEKVLHDFGRITQGEKAEYSFRFTNTGDGDLLIANAYASCGCTVPEFSREPIAPGKAGFIKVTFDSDKREDRFEKLVTVLANTASPETKLTITGFVIPRSAFENTPSH